MPLLLCVHYVHRKLMMVGFLHKSLWHEYAVIRARGLDKRWEEMLEVTVEQNT